MSSSSCISSAHSWSMSITEHPYIRHKATKCALTSKNENRLAFESDMAEAVENKAESLFCQILFHLGGGKNPDIT